MKASAQFVTIVPLMGVAAIVLVTARPPWTPARIVGLALLVFGIVMLTIARVQLGNAFSIAPEANTLVTRGIYSRIRHPVYVFSALALAGLCLYANRPRLLVVVAALIPVQVLRARAEQRVLEERFGDEYRAYQRKTWM